MDLPCLEDQKSCSYPFLRVLTAHFVPLPQSPDKILSIYSIDEKVDCLIRGVIQKNRYFTVRLTVRVEPPTFPPAYGQLFVIIFCLHLTIDYDFMCPETDFTSEIKSLQESKIPASCCCCSVTKWSVKRYGRGVKVLKNAFLRPFTI